MLKDAQRCSTTPSDAQRRPAMPKHAQWCSNTPNQEIWQRPVTPSNSLLHNTVQMFFFFCPVSPVYIHYTTPPNATGRPMTSSGLFINRNTTPMKWSLRLKFLHFFFHTAIYGFLSSTYKVGRQTTPKLHLTSPMTTLFSNTQRGFSV